MLYQTYILYAILRWVTTTINQYARSDASFWFVLKPATMNLYFSPYLKTNKCIVIAIIDVKVDVACDVTNVNNFLC